jgi:hypothetical protein
MLSVTIIGIVSIPKSHDNTNQILNVTIQIRGYRIVVVSVIILANGEVSSRSIFLVSWKLYAA